MTDLMGVALITAIPSMTAAVLGFFNNVLGRRNERHIAEAKAAIITLEKNTNSIKDALVKSTEQEAFARGTAQEKQIQEDKAAAVRDAHASGIEMAQAMRPPEPIPPVISRQESEL